MSDKMRNEDVLMLVHRVCGYDQRRSLEDALGWPFVGRHRLALKDAWLPTLKVFPVERISPRLNLVVTVSLGLSKGRLYVLRVELLRSRWVRVAEGRWILRAWDARGIGYCCVDNTADIHFTHSKQPQHTRLFSAKMWAHTAGEDEEQLLFYIDRRKHRKIGSTFHVVTDPLGLKTLFLGLGLLPSNIVIDAGRE